MTVGFGISPNLLTRTYVKYLSTKVRRSRARGANCPIPPVGNYTPPWERRPKPLTGPGRGDP